MLGVFKLLIWISGFRLSRMGNIELRRRKVSNLAECFLLRVGPISGTWRLAPAIHADTCDCKLCCESPIRLQQRTTTGDPLPRDGIPVEK